MRPRIAQIILWLLLLSSAAGRAQLPELSLSAGASRICLRDTLVIQFLITGEVSGATTTMPVFDGFRVTGSPFVTQEDNMRIVKGKRVVTKTESTVIRLIPLTTGTFMIPALKIKKRGNIYSSGALNIAVVSDCSLRKVDPYFRTAENDAADFEKDFRRSEAAGLVNFSEKILEAPGLFILAVNDRPAESNATAVTKARIKAAIRALDDTLPAAGYKRIGIFSIDGNPGLYYSLPDTSSVINKLREWLAGFRGMPFSIVDQPAWKRRKEALKQTPEYKLAIEIAGQADALLSLGEILAEPRNIYFTFTFKTAAAQQACISWAKDHGLRAPKPADLQSADGKAGSTFTWLCIQAAATPQTLIPRSCTVLSDVTDAFPGAHYEGITIQQLKAK